MGRGYTNVDTPEAFSGKPPERVQQRIPPDGRARIRSPARR
jgi:hypothetical protein